MEAPTSWNPQGLSRAVMGLLYLDLYLCNLPLSTPWRHAGEMEV